MLQGCSAITVGHQKYQQSVFDMTAVPVWPCVTEMLLVLNYPVYEVREVARKYVNCTELMRWADWTEAGAVAAARGFFTCTVDSAVWSC